MSEPALPRRRFPLRGALVALIFAFLGPPVGGLFFALPVLITAALSGTAVASEQWQSLGAFLVMSVFYSYTVGGIQALLAGLWCGARVWQFGTVTYREVFWVTIAASAFFIALIGIMQGIFLGGLQIFMMLIALLTSFLIRWGMGLLRIV